MSSHLRIFPLTEEKTSNDKESSTDEEQSREKRTHVFRRATNRFNPPSSVRTGTIYPHNTAPLGENEIYVAPIVSRPARQTQVAVAPITTRTDRFIFTKK